MNPSQILRLSHCDDFALHPETPDPRRWPLYDSAEGIIGKVEDLIVDLQAAQVRYVVVRIEMWDEWLETRPFRIVPVGLFHFDQTRHRAILPHFGLDKLVGFPAFSGEEVRPELEKAVHQAIGGASIADGEGMYGGPIYQHELFTLQRVARDDARI